MWMDDVLCIPKLVGALAFFSPPSFLPLFARNTNDKEGKEMCFRTPFRSELHEQKSYPRRYEEKFSVGFSSAAFHGVWLLLIIEMRMMMRMMLHQLAFFLYYL